MGKSRKAGKTLAHKEQTPLLPLSGNLQENLEASPCPPFSRGTRRRRHRSVRGTSIQQLVLSSPRSVCVFHLCVGPVGSDPVRPVTGSDRITTSPARAGTGEPLHRLEPVPVRGLTGSPVHRLVGSGNDKHGEATERRVLDSITQPNEHTFS